MPKISSVYTSRFIKSYELSKDTRTSAIIGGVTTEVFGNDFTDKLVAKLLLTDGAERDLVLNQNNAQRLAAAFGDNTDDWHGLDVILWVEDIDFRGETVASIKIGPAPPPMLPAPPKPPVKDELDDDIPF
jgi:hypothetical protein